MLFRLVQPMRRSGTRNPQFVKRIPVDIRERLIGRRLEIPVGDQTVSVPVTPRTESIRTSLRTADPSSAKVRQAEIAAYLETVFENLRRSTPVSLTGQQAVALSRRVYEAWSGDRDTAEGIEVTQVDGKWVANRFKPADDSEFEAKAAYSALANLERWEASDDEADKTKLKNAINPLIDRVLADHGIMEVDDSSRQLLARTFLAALKDALKIRQKRVNLDFTPDPNADRFPVLSLAPTTGPGGRVSMMGLVEGWWKEGRALGLKVSTYESYRNSMAALSAFVKHDDASRITPEDVVAFKDFRLNSINPRTKRPISPKTVKDSDLAGLKAVFGWAVTNRKLASNPAQGISIKIKKPRKLREKGFTDAEAQALLSAANTYTSTREKPQLVAAKRWVPCPRVALAHRNDSFDGRL